MGFPLAPWHMWGTTKLVTVAHPSSSALQFQQSTQLAKVNYARPETWAFFFGCEILAAPDAGLNPVNLLIDFDLILGVGRSSYQASKLPGVPGFCRFGFTYSTPGSALVGLQKWTTSVQSPLLDETVAAADQVRAFLDTFTAQDIQCSARVSTVAVDAADTPTKVMVTSYFAPRSHIRPEWFKEEFRGEETKGT
jgi:hypothetical protein